MISIKPDCKKANALMSGAVDRELSAEEFSYFDQHIEGCETCRNEFELEKLTQTYLKDRVALLDPPDDLLDSIRARLSEVDSVPVDNGQLTRLSSHRYLWPALGIAAVLVFMIISVFTKKSDKMSTEFSQQLPATTTPQTQDALEFSEYDFQTLLKDRISCPPFNPPPHPRSLSPTVSVAASKSRSCPTVRLSTLLKFLLATPPKIDDSACSRRIQWGE